MSDSEDFLEQAALDGTCDTTKWPSIFSDVLSRLEHNVFSIYNPPRLQPPPNAPPISSDALSDSVEHNVSSDPPPPSFPSANLTTSQTAHNSSSATSRVPAVAPPDHTIPPSLLSTYQFVVSSLQQNFSQKPPHTLQRLAELILRPTEHHRFLFSYLNALDRVSCVSSHVDVFPLPSTERPNGVIGSGPLVNGTTPVAANNENAFAGDDTLGGALLTPISWLRPGNNMGEDDMDYASSSPVVSPLSARSATSTGSEELHTEGGERIPPGRENGAMTQGELLRAEQEGSVPSPLAASTAAGNTSDKSDSPTLTDDDVPHVRGPEEIGMEDTGPQTTQSKNGVLDLEAAVGRKHHPHSHDGTNENEDTRDADTPMKADDDDAVIRKDQQPEDDIEMKTGDDPPT